MRGVKSAGKTSRKETTGNFFSRAARFCAYRERTIREVKDKLRTWGCFGREADQLINRLTEEKYVDETRFASLFAGGKFRIKKWGRIRIAAELRKKMLPDPVIASALGQLDETEYLETLVKLISRKAATLHETDPVKRYFALARFAASKGYEPGIVRSVLQQYNK